MERGLFRSDPSRRSGNNQLLSEQGVAVPNATQSSKADTPQVDFLITLDMASRIAAVEQSEKSRAIRDFLWTAMREEQDVQVKAKPAERPPAVQPAPVITQENGTDTENRYLSPFSFDGKNIRVIEVDGEPYWVAKDVAEALDYTWNATKTVGHVPDEWRGVESVPTPSGAQDMLTLSEQGLYFFVARSDKPRAVPFQKWVAGEVLPAIRKTGQYSIRNGSPQLEHKNTGRKESPIWLYDGPLVKLRWKAPSSRSQTAGGYLKKECHYDTPWNRSVSLPEIATRNTCPMPVFLVKRDSE
jgi:prophage antirepressor-like protein